MVLIIFIRFLLLKGPLKCLGMCSFVCCVGVISTETGSLLLLQ